MSRYSQSLEVLAAKLQVKYGRDDDLCREVVSQLRDLEDVDRTKRSNPSILARPIGQQLSWHVQEQATRGAPL
jgi:hypothetical protein